MRRYTIKSVKMQLVIFIFMIMMCSTALTGFLVIVSYYLQQPPIPLLMGVFLLVSTGVGTLLSYGLSRYFLTPIQDLVAATKEVAKGNYGVRVAAVDRERELGKLTHSFNQMVRELEGVELLKTDFINYFSHEFKTPIISIRGFARQLQQRDLPEAVRQEYADIIYKESERLVKMSTNVLLLTKLENQTLVTDQKLYSLDEQLRHCILVLQEEWERKNLELELDLAELEYYGNEEMLSQVWINLIGNAISYSSEHGKIAISCMRDINRIKVRIKDEGLGMTDQTMVKIFDKFYQGDLSHGAKGNGLGLPIVKRIIDLCGGSINVKSQVGKGSTFLVYLPYEKE